MVKTIPNGVLTSATSSTYHLGYELLGVQSPAAGWNIDRFDHPAHSTAASLRFSMPIRMALAQQCLLMYAIASCDSCSEPLSSSPS